jgi:N-acetylmuramic acid 6-phosphate etherase
MREDVVVGIAASGTTPFVRGALVEANRTGAATVLLTCNPEAPLARLARLTISLAVGPEVIAGSTRMKAGSATKLALNTITTGTMIRWGKVYGNRMVDVKPACAKLVERATRLVADLADVPHERAALLLEAGGGRVKVAIVMHRRGCTRKEAEKVLAHSSGLLRQALALDRLPPEPDAPPRARRVLVRKVKAEVPPVAAARIPKRTRAGGQAPLPAPRVPRRRRKLP